MCYRKKTKCEVEGSGQICIQCVRRNAQCVFPAQRETTPGGQRYCLFLALLFSNPMTDRCSEQYVQSLKDRLEKIESLLKNAGILNEADLHDDLSDEDELPDEDWDVAHQRSESFAQSSDGSYASLSSSGCDAALFPGGGDLEAAPLFRQHEKDDSRYFGELAEIVLPVSN